MSHIKLKAKIESLPKLLNFIESQCDKHLITSKDRLSIMLIAEELATNICNYAYPNKNGNFEVDIKFLSDRCCIKITDSGDPFDPTKAEEPDINASIEERKIGGLGLFLVSKNADELQYERAKNKNVVRITRMVKIV